MQRKIVIGITGASGSIYAGRLLQYLSVDSRVQFALCMSDNAKEVWKHELGNTLYESYKEHLYQAKDYNAPFASGSSSFDSLVIIPCSMGTLGRIANGISDNLINRCADVMLKERRKLVCVVRETPYNLIHIENMKKIVSAGGIICPATPSFYSKPGNMDQLVDTVVHRVLDILELPHAQAYKWNEGTD